RFATSDPAAADFIVSGSGVTDRGNPPEPDVERTGHSLRITHYGREPMSAELLSPRGERLLSLPVHAGANDYDLGGLRGLYLVRLHSGAWARMHKLSLI